MNEAENDLKYDGNTSNLSLPPGVDAHCLAREGIHILLNDGGVNHAQKLFQKYKFVILFILAKKTFLRRIL